jgi:hypothetical protein
MPEQISAQPTATSLKDELSESLSVLKMDFDGLKKFVAEIAPDGVPATIPLSKEELNGLLSAALEIQDAANDIAFEAGKIKDKLERLG